MQELKLFKVYYIYNALMIENSSTSLAYNSVFIDPNNFKFGNLEYVCVCRFSCNHTVF